MNDKVPPDDQPVTRTEAEGATVDLPEGLGFFTTGQVLGDRYEILEMLGRGGMGEVWRAFDLKLRVEVGLKALREELFQSERRLELLRQEVRAAREVVSPNVCRIFDLIEIDGRELVSMEYVDGATLLGVLQERGPLELKEAQDIASQFLAGLEAIHKAGLVHRDVKPENIMLTRAGRVVVMDFGLARGPESGAGSVSGTPAYMAPEHAAGMDVDARADVYSAGVVLAEMVSPDGVKSYESRQSVWEGVRSDPAQVPDSPWASVITRAVARDRERRQNSAHTLIRELEDVTLRVEGAEDLHPYPGLASFTESDAEYFFGREAEVEQMWRKLEGPPRMLGIMGPSGAGKTSFIRAGLTPNAPAGWSIIRCTPGIAAIASLRSTITPELANRTELLQALMSDPDNEDVIIDALSGWRAEHRGALIILDQFEELFTLSSKKDQRSFASLLGRLPLESDVHVLLAMRDDFAAYCNTHQALHPIFHELTVLNPPTGGNLRRALVQPATKCGYRFEDDDLVDEMLAEVEGERGALPLLAFAMSRLWEKRDRETGLLTRQAYHDIGGVGGALARHAEATVDRIGVERIPVVRELFRNLVTAEGTRAVREWDELLSVFGDGSGGEGLKPSPTKNAENPPPPVGSVPASGDPHRTVGAGFIPARDAAAEVLAELIDARLLTSYEVREDEHEPIRRVEIIHESLLANWPRLVRWQTQDADAVQLRDQLRQAAKTWDEHDRTDDTLWIGSAYREYALWRERYPGGLTEMEEAFAAAMTSLATRRRRRRRIAATAAVVVFAVVAIIFAGLWQRSVQETRRAEAQKLLAFGQLELEEETAAALAYARASLEISDTYEGRLFALRALSKGPIARFILPVVGEGAVRNVIFSPDSEWCWVSSFNEFSVYRRSGGNPVFEGRGGKPNFFTPDGRSMRYSDHEDEARLYSLPDFTETVGYRLDLEQVLEVVPKNQGLFLFSEVNETVEVSHWQMTSRPEPVTTLPQIVNLNLVDIDPSGEWIAFVPEDQSHHVYLKSLANPAAPARLVHAGDEPLSQIGLDPKMRWIAAQERGSPTITAWPLDERADALPRSFDGHDLPWNIDHQGTRIVEWGMPDGNPIAFIHDLRTPAGSEPLVIRSRARGELMPREARGIDPSGRWLGFGNIGAAILWPLPEDPPIILPTGGGLTSQLAFTPDSKELVIPSFRGLRLQSIEAGGGSQQLLSDRWIGSVAMDPRGRFAVLSDVFAAAAVILPFDGSEPTRLELGRDAAVNIAAFDPEREFVALGVFRGPAEHKVVGVWNLRNGTVQILGPTEGAGEVFEGGFTAMEFLPDGGLLTASRGGGVRRWNLNDGSSEVVLAGWIWKMVAAPDGRTAIVSLGDTAGGTRPVLLDLLTKETRPLDGFHGTCWALALSPRGDVLAMATDNGDIRIGALSGGEPHITFGLGKIVYGLAFSPDGRLIAAADQRGTVRVWPMPDMTKPPFQALPYDELMTKLEAFTNLRVVRDENSPTGWKQEIGPFQGWETAPTW